MPLLVENATCSLAGVFGCPRGACWWTTPPPRLLCRACCITVLQLDPLNA